MRRLISLALVAPLAVLAATPDAVPAPPAAPPATDPWTPVGDWERVDGKDGKLDQKVTALVRARVAQMIEPAGAGVKFKAEMTANPVEYGALRSLALMAALPRLAKQNAADTGADPKLFDAALAAIEIGFRPVLELAFPEVLEKADPKKPLSVYEVATNTKDKKGFVRSARAYGIGCVLMCCEFYFAGANRYAFDPAARTADRGVQPAPRTDLAVQIGVARLTALLLLAHSDKRTTFAPEFTTELKPGSVYSYDALGDSVADSCLSKTSTSVMGLRAALALGVAGFPEEAFNFALDPGGPALTKTAFLKRLSDVFVHCVLATTSITADPANGPGVVGRAAFEKESKERAGAAPVPAQEVNVTHYQTRYTRDREGRPLFRVYHSTNTTANPDADLLNGAELECAYRYLPGPWSYGAYHTAGGGYVLATSLSALPVVWAGAGKAKIEGQYTVTPVDGPAPKGAPKGSSPAWTVTAKDGTTYDVTIDPEKTLTTVRFGTLPVRQRLAQALNFVVRQLTVDGGPGKLRQINTAGRTVDGQSFVHTDAVLGIHPHHSTHQKYFRGIDYYGVFKFFLSVGAPDAVGNWAAYPALIELLSDEAYTGFNGTAHWAHNEFLLLTATRTYRPIFSRDSPQLKP